MTTSGCRLSVVGSRLPVLAAICFCATQASLHAAEPPKPTPQAEITDAELERVTVERKPGFSWTGAAKPVKPPTPVVPTTTSEAPVDLSSGELIIKALGEFSRVVKKVGDADKDVLTLTQDVEIEQLETNSVLRGQKVEVTHDLKTGDTELLEARGAVELVTPERKGKGDHLRYETRYGPHHETLKDAYILEGKPGVKAVFWQGTDVIEAGTFESDQLRNTFRASGRPAAVITLPAASSPPSSPPGNGKPVTGKDAPLHPGGTTQPGGGTPPAGGGMVPGLGLSGGKIRLQADDKLFFDGTNGRVTLTRNVVVQQQATAAQGGIKITSDQAVMSLSLPPPGQPGQSDSIFEGSLKTMESTGHVEILTATQNILCDKSTLDVDHNLFTMEMNDPKDSVRVYIREDTPAPVKDPNAPKSIRLMIVPKTMTVNTVTNEFKGGGAFRMESYTGATIPTNRPAPPATPTKPNDAAPGK